MSIMIIKVLFSDISSSAYNKNVISTPTQDRILRT